MSGSLNATLMRGFSGVFTSRLGFDRGAIVIKRKEEKDKVRRAREESEEKRRTGMGRCNGAILNRIRVIFTVP